MVLGRELSLPIDFTTRQHLSFSTNLVDTQFYAKYTLQLLEKCRELYKAFIEEHRAYYCELRNSQLKDIPKFQFGHIFFTRVQVHSVKSKGLIQKLQYVTRVPYMIVAITRSGSYELMLNNNNSTAIIKNHDTELCLSPVKIVP